MVEEKVYVTQEVVEEFTGVLITKEQAVELLDALYEIDAISGNAFLFEQMPHHLKTKE